MAEKKFYMGSFGPGLYDDDNLIDDVDGDFDGMYHGGLVSDGALVGASLGLLDTDASNVLSLVWNEDDSANRALNLLVNSGDRTLDLAEDLKVLSGQSIEFHASGGEKAQLAIDTQDAERTLDMSENLTIANGFNVTLQALGQANSLILNEGFTIGDGHPGTLTFSAASKVATIEDTFIGNNSAYVDGPLSPQVLSGCTISAGTNAGTAKVAAGTVLLRTTASDSGVLRKYSVSETDNITLTDANTRYFMQVQYNSGSPIATVSATTANGQTNINIGKVIKEADNTFHYINGGYRLSNGVAKLHHRAAHLREWEMCSEIQIGDNGDKTFTIAGGHFFRGITETTFSTWDSSGVGGDRFTYVHYYDGAWHYTTDQQYIDVDNYNDTSDVVDGLATCNKYKCDWVFVHPNDGDVYVVYGQDNDPLGNIEDSTVPNVPDLIDVFGALIGRIIVDGGVTVFQRIEMINTSTFIPSPVIDHNDLSGMDGGTTDQYYHMTSAQHSEVTTFFGSTDISAAEAETLTDTSDADTLHTHDLKANLAGPTFSGTVTVPSTNFTVGTQILTETNLTDLLDGGDTTLHDHDGIAENTAARHAAVTLNASATTGGLSLSTQEISNRAATNAQTGYATAAHITAIEANTSAQHTQGTDTTLGTMTADIDMNDTYQVVGLQAPAAAGEALRQTINITEADLETLTDGSDADALHKHDTYALESVVGTSIGAGLLLDGTVLKTSVILQKYHGVDPAVNVLSLLGAADYAAMMALLSGTATAEFLFNTQKIGGVVDPTTNQQAATKKYVDDNVGSGTVDVVSNVATDRMLGRTTAGSGDSEELTPAQGMAFLNGHAAADFAMNTHKITGVVDPTGNQDASTKKYVDDHAAGAHAILDGSVHTDSVADGVTRGSIIYGNATPKWDELVVGAANTFLGSDGTDLSYRTKIQVLTSLNVADGATKYPDTGEQAFLDADHTKLDDIEATADITDAVNIASSIHGVAAKATPVDADEVGLIDSAAANVLKKLTWTNIKATLKTYFDTLYNNYTLEAHKDSHDPQDGSDKLDTAAPSELANVQAVGVGTSHSFARADHQHQIQHSIADNHLVTIDGTVDVNEHSIFTANGIAGLTDAELLAVLSGHAAAAFDFNSQNLTGVGTIGCGTITTTGGYLLANGNYVGISGNERLEFYTAGYAAFMGCNVGIGTTSPTGVSTGTNLHLATTGETFPNFRIQRSGAVTKENAIWDMFIGSTGNLYFRYSLGGDIDSLVIGKDTGNVDIAQHNASTIGLKLGSTLITASAAEINERCDNALAPDHGVAATDMLVNVCYGTGSPPAANTTTEGALFVKYTA